MMSNLNGASAHMKGSDRKFQHLVLQIIGLACSTVGAGLAFMPGFKFKLVLTPHSIAGINKVIIIMY
jgi:hypothetical protein